MLNLDLFSSRIKHHDSIANLIDRLKPRYDSGNLIRVGGDGDGGYLVPDCLDGIQAVFSPGVDDKISFEADLAARGIRAHLCDASIDAVPPGLPEHTFEKLFLGPQDAPGHMTLESWFRKYVGADATGDYLLQMDIEGAEYPVLLSTPDSILRRFRIIVAEFHALDELFNGFSFAMMEAAFSRLLAGFDVAHLHPNNAGLVMRHGALEIPSVMEVTFVRKDWSLEPMRPPQFPHRLDRICVPDRPDMTLPECWWRR